MHKKLLIILSIFTLLLTNVKSDEIVIKQLKKGGNIIFIRHAIAPGGGDPENKPTLEDMQTKALAFEDILPILWALSQYKEPGSYSDFYEALKVN